LLSLTTCRYKTENQGKELCAKTQEEKELVHVGTKQRRNNKSCAEMQEEKKDQVETLDPLLGCYLKCTRSDDNMKKEAKESKELRLEVSSVDHVLKVRCKVDLQYKVYVK